MCAPKTPLYAIAGACTRRQDDGIEMNSAAVLMVVAVPNGGSTGGGGTYGGSTPGGTTGERGAVLSPSQMT